MIFKRQKRIYLDYAAGTPLDRRVFSVMQPYFSTTQGNPSAIYKEGVEAKKAVEVARSEIARMLGAHSDEIIFTGSGTEANNLAVFGIARAARADGVEKPHFITSAIEHPSVLNACRALEKAGEIEVTFLQVDQGGMVQLSELKQALRPETVFVSVMYANNEIGTIQPVKEIAAIIRRHRKNAKTENSKFQVLFHIDACQAMNYLDVGPARFGADLLTFNASKIYGPKGIGVLYKRRDVGLVPLIYGGEQEHGLRSGTENIAAIVGIAKALNIARAHREKESMRQTKLRDYFLGRVKEKFPETIINGSMDARLPNNVNVSFPDIESQLMIIELDAKGIAASAKSACASDEEDASYVVAALGGEKWRSENSVRFSLGRYTTKKDIDATVEALLEIAQKYSKL